MKKLTEHQSAMLHAFADGKKLCIRKVDQQMNIPLLNVQEVLLDGDGWEVSEAPDPVEMLAALVYNTVYQGHNKWDEKFSETTKEAYRRAIRALAEKCPALLEVEL